MAKEFKNLPWNEIVDRLYRRQEVEGIVEDLETRGIIKEGQDKSEILQLFINLKSKVESFRISGNS
jgi:hypothetical protein